MKGTGKPVRAQAGANMPISTLTLAMCIEGDFWSWWTEHAELFAEPPIRHVSVEHSVSTDQNALILSVPLENKLSVSMKQIRRLLEPQVQKAARKKTQS